GDHHAPLDLGAALQETGGVAAEHRQHRQGEEGIDRDEDREQAVPLLEDQPVLQRDQQVEGGHQRQVVAGAGGGEGDELAQGEERDEGEHHQGGYRADREA